MNTTRLTILALGLAALGGCSEEIPPRTSAEFLEDPILLEATMVRCAADRSRTKYEAECVNARDAVNRLAAAEEEARKQELDRQSERKRQALRRTQQAAADARRRAAEMRRLQEEAAYLAQFSAGQVDGNVDAAVRDEMYGLERPAPAVEQSSAELPGNVPGAVVSPEPEAEESSVPVPADEPASDIDSIRQELKRRQETSQ